MSKTPMEIYESELLRLESVKGADSALEIEKSAVNAVAAHARREALELLRDHYWDSLTPHRDLILAHIEGTLLNASPAFASANAAPQVPESKDANAREPAANKQREQPWPAAAAPFGPTEDELAIAERWSASIRCTPYQKMIARAVIRWKEQSK